MAITTDRTENEPQDPPPANDDNHHEQPRHVNHHHHREEPPYPPLPPEFRSYIEILIYLTRLNLHNTTCPNCGFQNPIIHPHSNPQNPANYVDNKPTFRVYTKAKTDYSLTIRDHKVTLAPTNPSDLHQHWIKDEKFGMNIRDATGDPAFDLINKATGQAIKCSIGVTFPVRLDEYNPNRLDMTVLWTRGNGLSHGYRSFKPVTNILLNLHAFNGLKEDGGVPDGTDTLFCGKGPIAITKVG